MATAHGSCLCGDVAWTISAPLDLMTHCHCSRCRKAHGSAFATFVGCPVESFAFARGRDGIVTYESSPGLARPFCGRCGGTVPSEMAWDDRILLPAGPLDDDPGTRPLAHIFMASRAPWFEIEDALPRFDAYPPGVGAPVIPDPPPTEAEPGVARGSCLCGSVAFAVEGPATRAYHCHCSRCRKARAAAHASNLFAAAGALRFTRGEELLASYKVPEARYFMQVFCRTCGSPMPRVDRERDLAVVPMGSLDDDPGTRPSRHIFVGSMAPWYAITDRLPQDAEFPPAT
jgi:hypothetical protein